jgi:hypothetical protein
MRSTFNFINIARIVTLNETIAEAQPMHTFIFISIHNISSLGARNKKAEVATPMNNDNKNII